MTRRCLADISGPFFHSAKPFRNWSALPFYQLDLPHPPYVDLDQLAWGVERALAYLQHIHAQGYTGIVIDNLAHLVTFAQAPVAIYTPDSPYRLRALQYQQAFRHVFVTAAQLAMEVFVTSDMQWSTPPLRTYVGQMNADNPRLYAINRWALDELFAVFPQVTGLMVRTGEAGGAHNQGASYAGHMLYTTVKHLRGLTDTLLACCEDHGRLLVMRTWSVGIGALGDLLCSPERYHAVFGGYTSPHLLVSIKHGPADFFRLLPHNPTLGLPGPCQIIELQNRREYELFGMVPSSIVELHEDVIRHAEATNPHFAGVWAWNSSGGWGGGRAALGQTGWSVWTELSSALTAALVRNSACDTTALVRCWCEERFGSTFGAAVADVYLESADLVEQGWYVGQMTHRRATIGGLYVPSLLWIWWMRPTASLVAWAYLAGMLADSNATERASAGAAARLAWHAARLAALAPPDHPDSAAVAASVRYFADVIAVAHAICTLMGRAFIAAWLGQRSHWYALALEAQAVRQVLDCYRVTWADNADLPPLELEEIDAFLHAFARTPGVLWVEARLACAFVRHVQAGALPQRYAVLGGIGRAILRAFVVVSQQQEKVAVVGALAALLLTPPLRRRLVKAALPSLSRHLYLFPSIFFETGPSFTEWTE